MPTPRPLLVAALGLAAVTGLAACSEEPTRVVPVTPGSTAARPPGSSAAPGGTTPGTTGTTVPGTTPRGGARVERFELPNDISCHGSGDVQVGATWSTTGATSVLFVVDGTQVPGTRPPSGQADVPVPCDGDAHTVVLVAVDGDGGTTVQSRAVLTSTAPRGD